MQASGIHALNSVFAVNNAFKRYIKHEDKRKVWKLKCFRYADVDLDIKGLIQPSSVSEI